MEDGNPDIQKIQPLLYSLKINKKDLNNNLFSTILFVVVVSLCLF